MEFEIIENLSELSDEALAEYLTNARAAFTAIKELGGDATDAQVQHAHKIADSVDAGVALSAERTEAAAAVEAQRQSLADRSIDPAPETVAAADPAPAEPVVEPAPVPEVQVAEPAPVPAASARATLAGGRPEVVSAVNQAKPVQIIAAPNTVFDTGSDLGSDLSKVTEATAAKMMGFSTPNGDGKSENLQMYPVAKFGLDFPEELTIDRSTSDDEGMAVLHRAGDEHRLPGDSLVAAAGWCAPSETIYDLCSTESTDGIGSVPEVAVKRGGIKFTSGPDFSAIYGASGYFDFTEAQSIAGTGQSVNKPCMTVPCPSFTDVRLDSVGLCIKIEFLANAAYPEVTQRFISGALIAQQHKVWVKVLGKMLAAASAKTFAGTGLGSVAADTFDGLTLYAAQLRQKYKLPLNSSLEVLLPFWLKDVIKTDISRRTGQPFQAVTDEQIMAMFRARQLNPQFVYGLGSTYNAVATTDLLLADVTGPPAEDADAWPGTFTALMYPAGTFVKGTADVVNLSAVYDAASLANNVYTGLFAEQGVLVAQLCPEAFKVTLPVCLAGRTGKADLACS